MRKKIIVVEDDPDILFTISLILDNAGYDVESLSSGKCIMEENYACPDLFILDKRMPDMDGLEVCRHIRTETKTHDIPIIMISASPKFGPQALVAGANDFLEKPFQLKALERLVEKHLT